MLLSKPGTFTLSLFVRHTNKDTGRLTLETAASHAIGELFRHIRKKSPNPVVSR